MRWIAPVSHLTGLAILCGMLLWFGWYGSSEASAQSPDVDWSDSGGGLPSNIWPEEMVCTAGMPSLEEPAVYAPCLMTQDIQAVWMECEVKGWEAKWSSPADVVSPTQDYGVGQLNIIHAPLMFDLGLDFFNERDRLIFMVNFLWPEQGWGPWSCKYMIGW